MSSSWPDDPKSYMAAYLEAWNEGDADRVYDAYHVTAPIFTDGVVQGRDAESRLAYLGAYLDLTRGELAEGTRWECPSSQVTAQWVFRRMDGTVLEDYPDSYLLVRIGGRWAFLADVIHTT